MQNCVISDSSMGVGLRKRALQHLRKFHDGCIPVGEYLLLATALSNQNLGDNAWPSLLADYYSINFPLSYAL